MKISVKFFSLLLLLTFSVSDLAQAATLVGSSAPTAFSKTSNFLEPFSFQVPIECSQYKEGYQAPMRGGVPAPLVILIQDAHANLSGQENLAKTLDVLMDRYQFSDVLVEGGEGDVTLTPLRELADASVIKRVAGRFLREAQISGEEYLNLTSSRDMKLTGIEDLDLYSKGLQAYADLAQKRETILNYLTKSRAVVEQLKKRHYPYALLAYEKASGRISSPEKLAQLAQGQGIEFSDFKEITRLSALLAEEKKIDFSLAQLELASLVEKVGAKDSGNLAKELALKPKQKGVGQLAYFKKIADSAKAHGLSLAATPQFQNYFSYLEKFSKLDMEKLLEESKKLEQMVYTQLLDHAQAHTLRAVDRYLSLLETAYRIQMTSDEFASFLENTPDFPTISWQAFLNKALFDEGLTESFIPLERHLEEGRQALEKFYRAVDQRDFAFVKNVEKVMKNKKIAALIAGGYHTRHLAKLLREKGYSYVVVAPNVSSETNQAKYEKVLLSPITQEIKTVQTVQGRALKAGVDGQRGLSLALAAARLSQLVGATGAQEFSLGVQQLLDRSREVGAKIAGARMSTSNFDQIIAEARKMTESSTAEFILARNLRADSKELIPFSLRQITEETALAMHLSGFIGKGDKNVLDLLAVRIHREGLQRLADQFHVTFIAVNSEGLKDASDFVGNPSLYYIEQGERFAPADGLSTATYMISNDGLDGTSNTAKFDLAKREGENNEGRGTSVILVGKDLIPVPDTLRTFALVYRGPVAFDFSKVAANKAQVGQGGKVSLEDAIADWLQEHSRATGIPLNQIQINLMGKELGDRGKPHRHQQLYQKLKPLGVQISTYGSGTMTPQLLAAIDPRHVYVQIAGATETMSAFQAAANLVSTDVQDPQRVQGVAQIVSDQGFYEVEETAPGSGVYTKTNLQRTRLNMANRFAFSQKDLDDLRSRKNPTTGEPYFSEDDIEAIRSGEKVFRLDQVAPADIYLTSITPSSNKFREEGGQVIPDTGVRFQDDQTILSTLVVDGRGARVIESIRKMVAARLTEDQPIAEPVIAYDAWEQFGIDSGNVALPVPPGVSTINGAIANPVRRDVPGPENVWNGDPTGWGESDPSTRTPDPEGAPGARLSDSSVAEALEDEIARETEQLEQLEKWTGNAMTEQRAQEHRDKIEQLRQRLNGLDTAKVSAARLASYYLLGKNINSFISEQRLNGLIDNQQKRIRTRLQVGVGKYVEDEKRKGKKLSDSIVSVTVKSVMDWLQSPAIDKYTKLGLLKALAQQRFGHITAAHSSKVVFGTAGPRQFTVFNMEEANELLEKGFQAEILKGPKTINSITFMRLAEGTARYYKKVAEKQGRPPVMTLAYDSRIQNPAFADAVAAVFIRNGFNVYLFDQASPTPVLSFGAAYVKSHVGILLSASHNDYRYGGFKVFGGDGAQLGPNERNGVIEHTYGKGAVGAKDYVPPVELNDIEEVLSASAQVESDAYTPETLKQNIYRGPLVRQFSEGSPRQVTILGEKNNAGDAKTPAQIDIISIYVKHVLNQFADLDLVRRQAPNIKLLYMPFYGVGLRVFTRVLKELGFKDENVKIAKEVARMDGRFPIFSNQLDAEGNPQIPDPGSSKGNADAVEMAIQQHIQDTNNDPVEALGGIDVQIGTDPDADRAGASVPIPEEFLPKEEAQRRALLISYAAGDPEAAKRLGFSGLRLLSANDKWTLITKYRIDRFAEKIAAGSIEKDTPFVIIKSHVTTDALKALVNYGKKRGVQVEIDNTYVGFSLLAEKGKRAWEEGKVVLSMAEESGGFSYMGAPPPFYLIMSQFQKIDGLNLRISGDQIVANNKVSGLLTTEVAKYYHYSAQSLRDTLEFLSEEGVLERADGGFKLSRAYAAKRTASHDEFWTPLRSLAVETPGSAHGDPTFGFIPHQMGNMGHTLDKDGPMASFLLLEVLAYAKEKGMTLHEYLVKDMYLEQEIGLFPDTNQPKTFDNGPAGTIEKYTWIKAILEMARDFAKGREIFLDVLENGEVVKKKVTGVQVMIPVDQKNTDPEFSEHFPVDKYYEDLKALLNEPRWRDNPEGLLNFFPEEGVRFYFGPKGIDGNDYVTARPSGTEPKVRFYVQLNPTDVEGRPLSTENLPQAMFAGASSSLAMAVAMQEAVEMRVSHAARLAKPLSREELINETVRAVGAEMTDMGVMWTLSISFLDKTQPITYLSGSAEGPKTLRATLDTLLPRDESIRYVQPIVVLDRNEEGHKGTIVLMNSSIVPLEIKGSNTKSGVVRSANFKFYGNEKIEIYLKDEPVGQVLTYQIGRSEFDDLTITIKSDGTLQSVETKLHAYTDSRPLATLVQWLNVMRLRKPWAMNQDGNGLAGARLASVQALTARDNFYRHLVEAQKELTASKEVGQGYTLPSDGSQASLNELTGSYLERLQAGARSFSAGFSTEAYSSAFRILSRIENEVAITQVGLSGFAQSLGGQQREDVQGLADIYLRAKASIDNAIAALRLVEPESKGAKETVPDSAARLAFEQSYPDQAAIPGTSVLRDYKTWDGKLIQVKDFDGQVAVFEKASLGPDYKMLKDVPASLGVPAQTQVPSELTQYLKYFQSEVGAQAPVSRHAPGIIYVYSNSEKLQRAFLTPTEILPAMDKVYDRAVENEGDTGPFSIILSYNGLVLPGGISSRSDYQAIARLIKSIHPVDPKSTYYIISVRVSGITNGNFKYYVDISDGTDNRPMWLAQTTVDDRAAARLANMKELEAQADLWTPVDLTSYMTQAPLVYLKSYKAGASKDVYRVSYEFVPAPNVPGLTVTIDQRSKEDYTIAYNLAPHNDEFSTEYDRPNAASLRSAIETQWIERGTFKAYFIGKADYPDEVVRDLAIDRLKLKVGPWNDEDAWQLVLFAGHDEVTVKKIADNQYSLSLGTGPYAHSVILIVEPVGGGDNYRLLYFQNFSQTGEAKFTDFASYEGGNIRIALDGTIKKKAAARLSSSSVAEVLEEKILRETASLARLESLEGTAIVDASAEEHRDHIRQLRERLDRLEAAEDQATSVRTDSTAARLALSAKDLGLTDESYARAAGFGEQLALRDEGLKTYQEMQAAIRGLNNPRDFYPTVERYIERLKQRSDLFAQMAGKSRYFLNADRAITILEHHLVILENLSYLISGNFDAFRKGKNGYQPSDSELQPYAQLVDNFSADDIVALVDLVLLHDMALAPMREGAVDMADHPALGAAMTPAVLAGLGLEANDLLLRQWTIANHSNVGPSVTGEQNADNLIKNLQQLPAALRQKALVMVVLETIAEVRSIFQPGTPQFGLFLSQANVGQYQRFATEQGVRDFVDQFPIYRLRSLAVTSSNVLDQARYDSIMAILDSLGPKKEGFLSGFDQIKLIDYGKFVFDALDPDSLIKLLYAVVRFNQKQTTPLARLSFNTDSTRGAQAGKNLNVALGSYPLPHEMTEGDVDGIAEVLGLKAEEGRIIVDSAKFVSSQAARLAKSYKEIFTVVMHENIFEFKVVVAIGQKELEKTKKRSDGMKVVSVRVYDQSDYGRKRPGSGKPIFKNELAIPTKQRSDLVAKILAKHMWQSESALEQAYYQLPNTIGSGNARNKRVFTNMIKAGLRHASSSMNQVAARLAIRKVNVLLSADTAPSEIILRVTTKDDRESGKASDFKLFYRTISGTEALRGELHSDLPHSVEEILDFMETELAKSTGRFMDIRSKFISARGEVQRTLSPGARLTEIKGSHNGERTTISFVGQREFSGNSRNELADELLRAQTQGFIPTAVTISRSAKSEYDLVISVGDKVETYHWHNAYSIASFLAEAIANSGARLSGFKVLLQSIMGENSLPNRLRRWSGSFGGDVSTASQRVSRRSFLSGVAGAGVAATGLASLTSTAAQGQELSISGVRILNEWSPESERVISEQLATETVSQIYVEPNQENFDLFRQAELVVWRKVGGGEERIEGVVVAVDSRAVQLKTTNNKVILIRLSDISRQALNLDKLKTELKTAKNSGSQVRLSFQKKVAQGDVAIEGTVFDYETIETRGGKIAPEFTFSIRENKSGSITVLKLTEVVAPRLETLKQSAQIAAVNDPNAVINTRFVVPTPANLQELAKYSSNIVRVWYMGDDNAYHYVQGIVRELDNDFITIMKYGSILKVRIRISSIRLNLQNANGMLQYFRAGRPVAFHYIRDLDIQPDLAIKRGTASSVSGVVQSATASGGFNLANNYVLWGKVFTGTNPHYKQPDPGPTPDPNPTPGQIYSVVTAKNITTFTSGKEYRVIHGGEIIRGNIEKNDSETFIVRLRSGNAIFVPFERSQKTVQDQKALAQDLAKNKGAQVVIGFVANYSINPNPSPDQIKYVKGSIQRVYEETRGTFYREYFVDILQANGSVGKVWLSNIVFGEPTAASRPVGGNRRILNRQALDRLEDLKKSQEVGRFVGQVEGIKTTYTGTIFEIDRQGERFHVQLTSPVNGQGINEIIEIKFADYLPDGARLADKSNLSGERLSIDGRFAETAQLPLVGVSGVLSGPDQIVLATLPEGVSTAIALDAKPGVRKVASEATRRGRYVALAGGDAAPVTIELTPEDFAAVTQNKARQKELAQIAMNDRQLTAGAWAVLDAAIKNKASLLAPPDRVINISVDPFLRAGSEARQLELMRGLLLDLIKIANSGRAEHFRYRFVGDKDLLETLFANKTVQVFNSILDSKGVLVGPDESVKDPEFTLASSASLEGVKTGYLPRAPFSPDGGYANSLRQIVLTMAASLEDAESPSQAFTDQFLANLPIGIDRAKAIDALKQFLRGDTTSKGIQDLAMEYALPLIQVALQEARRLANIARSLESAA